MPFAKRSFSLNFKIKAALNLIKETEIYFQDVAKNRLAAPEKLQTNSVIYLKNTNLVSE